MKYQKHVALGVVIFLTILAVTPISGTTMTKTVEPSEIFHDVIIEQGYRDFQSHYSIDHLEQWFSKHPDVLFASAIADSLTIKFVDNTYVVLLNLHSLRFTLVESYFSDQQRNFKTILHTDENNSALILNPSEYLYGNHHCQGIMDSLDEYGYSSTYLADDAVTLRYVEQNLSADILYMNTHAGYWDTDGDHRPDAVVVATGETWTNETPNQYSFEYENQMIVEGIVANDSFIAFTPELIDHFYYAGDFADALIYMATCHAAYGDTMAQVFLALGASAYIGWTRDTIFWTNSITSQIAFYLLTKGLTIRQVCFLIRYGGLLNMLLLSRLVYYGDGSYQLPPAESF